MRLLTIVLITSLSIPFTASAAPNPEQKAFVTYLVKSGKEPKVKDATWATDRNLYVGVIDDKTRRDSFADYICSIASDHRVTPELVKVIDIAKLVKTGKFVEIGKAYCS